MNSNENKITLSQQNLRINTKSTSKVASKVASTNANR